MNHFISGIIKIILLEAHAGLVFFDRVVGDKYDRQRRFAFIFLACAMVFAWTNYGALRGNFTIVQSWEQFHFYLGAKYQHEVGWFDLYKASWLADRETAHALNVKEIRDISTFELVPVETALVDAPRIRARFTDERWAEFKADWLRMLQVPNDWNRVLQDHGNSNSPAWALIAHPIAELVPLTPGGQTFLGLLDMVLMGIMWWFVFKSFGTRVGCIGLFMWAVPPLVFDYLAGSFLRWDWVFCLGMSMVFMKREKWATAGGFFGFAVATKLFPLWFGVALGARALMVIRSEKKVPTRYSRFGAATVAVGLAAVLLSSAMFGGFWAWKEYAKRIEVAQLEKFYGIQYSLKTVYLQVAESSPGEIANGWLFPAEIKQARVDVDIDQHVVGFFLARLLFSALILVLVLRSDDISAFALGPLLVFTWLTVNMYYWNMFGLLALGLARRDGQKPALGALIGLHVIFMGYFLYQHTNRGFAEGYMVAMQLCLWIVSFAVFEWREIRHRLGELFPVVKPAPPVVASGKKARS